MSSLEDEVICAGCLGIVGVSCRHDGSAEKAKAAGGAVPCQACNRVIYRNDSVKLDGGGYVCNECA